MLRIIASLIFVLMQIILVPAYHNFKPVLSTNPNLELYGVYIKRIEDLFETRMVYENLIMDLKKSNRYDEWIEKGSLYGHIYDDYYSDKYHNYIFTDMMGNLILINDFSDIFDYNSTNHAVFDRII